MAQTEFQRENTSLEGGMGIFLVAMILMGFGTLFFYLIAGIFIELFKKGLVPRMTNGG